MSDLEFFTYNGKIDDTMPNVLISIHPHDRFKYLQLLIELVSHAYNCNVCVSCHPCDGKTDLSVDIHLVVVAVTEKYITWKNSGFVSEFMYFKQQGVAVLPVMFELGINNLFNTRFGKLQYIDFTTPEAVDKYRKKFISHVAAVLSSNHIQNHYVKGTKKIFISYRKRDICHLTTFIGWANAVNDGSFSMWYDSNLTPGEDYKDAILDALMQCDIYLMLVTPNVLEENNYVMRVEYPLAKKQGKVIIPLMMEKTDFSLLSRKFDGIPRCVSDKHINALISKFKQ